MMDFISHLVESMLWRAMRSSPGVRGDTEEPPSPEEHTFFTALECQKTNEDLHVSLSLVFSHIKMI